NKGYQIPDAIQFDASINKGNSGGPLFNARCEVIGITQQIATPTEASAGIAFAVSSNLVLHALDSWRSTGRISHADLGIDAQTVTPQLNARADLGSDSGAVIQSAYGPAAAAQLATGPKISYLGTTVATGDVIVEIAGRKITNRYDLARTQGLIDPTHSVQITYLRGGTRHETTLTPAVRAIA
ncbi:MAG: serine protease, partial [Thermoleophilia bacterium]|nr:serine protease [Thermoleophilia bacterium]